MRKQVTIALTIDSCKQCPFFTTNNHWSSDGFDRMEDWYCKKAEKVISGSVEWHEEKDIEIPKFCPLRIKK